MTRVKRGVQASKRRKKTLKKTKGYLLGRSKKYRQAKEAHLKASTYAFRDRKAKKGQFRKLWIIRLNAAVRKYGLSYSAFIAKLKKAKIEIDRKVLSDIAINNPKVFKKLIDKL